MSGHIRINPMYSQTAPMADKNIKEEQAKQEAERCQNAHTHTETHKHTGDCSHKKPSVTGDKKEYCDKNEKKDDCNEKH